MFIRLMGAPTKPTKDSGGWRLHVGQLEQVFALFGQRPRGKHCEGIAGILEEGRAVMQQDFDEPTMDACGSAGRVGWRWPRTSAMVIEACLV